MKFSAAFYIALAETPLAVGMKVIHSQRADAKPQFKTTQSRKAAVVTEAVFTPVTDLAVVQPLAHPNLPEPPLVIPITHQLGFLIDDEFRSLFHLQSASARHLAMEQLGKNVLTTKHIDPVLVWAETNILIDGYRRIAVWDALPAEEKAKILAPTIIYISLPGRAAALVERLNLKNGQLTLTEDERILTVLRNPTLREELRKAGAERQRGGKKIKNGKKGDTLSALAGMADGRRDRVYKWTIILDDPDADSTIQRILTRQLRLNQAFKIAKSKRQAAEITRALLEPLPPLELQLGKAIDTVLHGEAEKDDVWARVPDIHLTVTSPPYAHKTLWEPYGKPYPGYAGWIALMENVFRKTFEHTVDGGKCVINISNVTVPPDEGEKESPPALRRDCSGDIKALMKSIGWIWRDEVIWSKQNADCNRPMVGGKRSARFNPSYEWLLVFGKGNRNLGGDQRLITDQQFYKSLIGGVWDIDHLWTDNGDIRQGDGIWNLYPERKTNITPCAFPYPEVIPASFIQLFAYMRMNVFDPFAGSGTTLTAAKKLGLHYVGIDDNEQTVKYALDRLQRVHQGDAIDPWQGFGMPPEPKPLKRKYDV